MATQASKSAAAALYDYENDPRWADYWRNILIPPNMAARPDVVNHFKRKFYQRYIDPGLVVEAIPLSGTSQTTRPSSSNPRNQTRQQNSEFTTRASSRPVNPASLRWDQQTIQFSLNAWVFVVAVLAVFPLLPQNLSNRAYRLSLTGTACSSLYSLYSLYRKPRAWNLEALRSWFYTILGTKDCICFIYCLIFVTSQLSLKFALIPILCRAIEIVASFLRRNFGRSSMYRKYFEELCVWVESNATTIRILSSQAEIGIGFLLIISLVSWQRNIVRTCVYWQLLKLMYHAPVTAGYHQSMWGKIGRTVNPLVHSYAPFLSTPISTIQKWWLM